VSVKASSASDPGAYYYYLYDWEVEEVYPECIGERVPVEAKVVTKPGAPATQDLTVCDDDPGPYVLTASASGNGEIRWYDAQTDGAQVGTGENYEVQTAQDVSYFAEEVVEEQQTLFGAPSSNVFGDGGNHAGGFYLIFDATEEFTLLSAKVYATGAKDRTLELRDATEAVIDSKVISVPDGESTIDINMTIPAGTGLQLGFADGADLFRNNTGVAYPYAVGDNISITSSSAGAEYYYYLYNWEVSAPGFECASERNEARLTVDVCTGINAYAERMIDIYPNPSHGIVTVTPSKDLEVSRISVLDSRGNMLLSGDATNSQIDLSNVKSGVYFIQVESTTGTLQRKIIVQ
jgi:hypothetical protein